MTCNSTDISKKTWRKLMILIIVMLAVICVRLNAKPAYAAEEVESGTCGENLTWVLDNEGILIISGEGDMSSWAPSKVPWKKYQNKIKNVITTKITDYNDGVILEKDASAFDYAREKDIEIVAAAITTVPYNEESMAFHAKMEFHEIGEQLIRGGTVKISQQVLLLQHQVG